MGDGEGEDEWGYIGGRASEEGGRSTRGRTNES
jgi:hypothetical protein